MRRATGLAVDLELRLYDLFISLSTQRERGLYFELPELRWLTGQEPGSHYAQLQRGPLRVIGQWSPAYLFVQTENCFSHHCFLPGIGGCRIEGSPPSPYLRLYPEDVGPWWDVLAGALPEWEEAIEAAYYIDPFERGRQEALAQARALVTDYQGGLHG